MELTSSVGNKLVPGDELGYDRAKEVKEFDETKAGVKGLVDSGVTKVPRFLIHPPESLPMHESGSIGVPILPGLS